MNEIWLAPNRPVLGTGTKESPHSVSNSAEFDELMRSYAPFDQLAVHLNDGVFLTAGTREWDEGSKVGFRVNNWTFDTETGATLQWDSSAVPDDRVDDVPLHLLCSNEPWRKGVRDAQAVWDSLPVGQTARGLTIDLQFSTAVDRWKSLGKKLRIGAVLFSGHEAAIESVHVVDAGALGYEGFPLVITGGIGQPDRDAIAQLDPVKYVLDSAATDLSASHITDCLFDQFDETLTNDQVTVRMIVGNVGERTLGTWQQHFRRFAYQSGNRTVAKGKNLVQAHTIYQSLRGRIDRNYSAGAAVGVYGDFYSTRGLNVSLNQFLGCDYAGIRFLLSPTGPCPEQFSHEDYAIGPNQITSAGPNVSLDTLGPSTSTRYIRNISVDGALSLENNGATGVTRTGAIPPDPARKGCLPGFLHR